MPKKNFQYKTALGLNDVWYTDSLKGWFIVKEENQYFLRKGSIYKNTLELGTKRFKVYQRLGDAKVGLENYCKDYIESFRIALISPVFLKSRNLNIFLANNEMLDMTEKK